MGTNYYHRTKPCEKCGSHKTERHIGKSSCGWQFHFRGYRYDMIVSFKDWINEFKDENKEIYDEYGNNIDIKDFLEKVAFKKSEKLNHYNILSNNPINHYEIIYIKDHPNIYSPDDLKKRTWKDDEGYCFTDCEFS